MKESIILDVVVDTTPTNTEEQDFEIRVDLTANIFYIYLKNKLICYGDWFENLRYVFTRALEIWPSHA